MASVSLAVSDKVRMTGLLWVVLSCFYKQHCATDNAKSAVHWFSEIDAVMSALCVSLCMIAAVFIPSQTLQFVTLNAACMCCS
jgi:hypothetical protein